jgi:large subunit ribosomal protein L4
MKLPKQLKQLARKSALSTKAQEGNIKVVEDFNFEKPSTKEMAAVLNGLGLATKKVLLLVPKTDINIFKSSRNMPRVNVLEAAKASTYEIVDSQTLVLQKSAVDALQKSFPKE